MGSWAGVFLRVWSWVWRFWRLGWGEREGEGWGWGEGVGWGEGEGGETREGREERGEKIESRKEEIEIKIFWEASEREERERAEIEERGEKRRKREKRKESILREKGLGMVLIYILGEERGRGKGFKKSVALCTKFEPVLNKIPTLTLSYHPQENNPPRDSLPPAAAGKAGG